MEITKILLKDVGERLFFSYPENISLENENFRIGFSLSQLKENENIRFGSESVSSYHMVLDGRAEVASGEAAAKSVVPGQTFSCEEYEQIELSGSGRVFNMFMAGGVRGFIRMERVEQEKKMRVGEAMGGSVIALWGFDEGFELVWDKERLRCEPGSLVIVQIGKAEFCNLNLIPDKEGMSMACVTGVMLSNNDFGKYIGVRFLERGEGTGKARLDIRPEHMNPIGTVHGGCLFTLADAVCGVAASSQGGICTTVNSNIQFLNAAFWPKYLIAEAKPKKLGRKIRSFLVEVRDDKNVLICTVDMVFYNLQK